MPVWVWILLILIFVAVVVAAYFLKLIHDFIRAMDEEDKENIFMGGHED